MPDQPNIVLIVADDLGYGDCSCYGSTTLHTPCIDRIAAEGIRFTDFHANGPVCSPTRAALMTGRYQQRGGVDGVLTVASHRHTGLHTDEVTIAEVLRDAGYATGLFGKWHLGYDPQYNPSRRGFDEFRGFVSGNIDYFSHIDQGGKEDWWLGGDLIPEEGYTTDLVTRHGLRFLEENRDRPFFLYLAHECPHYPYQGPADGPYRTVGHPDPVHGPRTDQAAAYKEMMEAMDEGIGRIVDAVDRLGLGEKTLIVFFSDNGPVSPGSAGPWRGGKCTLWEGGHREPACLRWTGRVAPGQVCDAPVLGMDLFPTFASLAGATVPQDRPIDGVDLAPVLDGQSDLPPRPLFWGYQEQFAARRGRFKLMRNPRDADEAWRLSDLAADPAEAEDHAADHPEIVAALRGELTAWAREVGAPGWVDEEA